MFKSLIKEVVPKLLELIAVIIIGAFVCGLITGIFNSEFVGYSAVAVVFYYFGAIIRPYIMDIVGKLTKNLGKKDEKDI